MLQVCKKDIQCPIMGYSLPWKPIHLAPIILKLYILSIMCYRDVLLLYIIY